MMRKRTTVRWCRVKPGASWFLLLASCLLLFVSCAPTSPPAAVPASTHTPALLPTRASGSAPESTAVPTWTPTPTVVPTPAPTVDPAAVSAIAAHGLARMEARGVEPLCLRWEDVDADGGAEWVGLYFRDGLQAFVLDGDVWHDLLPLAGSTYGLGEYATCELEVRDVNADGRIEILVWGHAGTSTDVLHVFVWDGATYALVAPFEGEAGVRLANTDGDLLEEVSVRYDAARDLVWEAVYTWDGKQYGWTWERYVWRYLDRPHTYLDDTPEHVVISFYLAIDDRDVPAAYALTSPEAQEAQPYDGWAAGYATTVAAEVGSVHEQGERNGGIATVAAQVRAYDNVDGRVVVSLWDVTWKAAQTGGGWRLASASATRLDQWEASYYP
jgi:hypothetical protein